MKTVKLSVILRRCFLVQKTAVRTIQLMASIKLSIIAGSVFLQAKWTVSSADKALCEMKGKDTKVQK